MDISKLNIRDIIGALIVLAFGAFLVWKGLDYPLGSLHRMGPGFFPVGIGVVLIVLALALLPEAIRGEDTRFDLPIRPFAAVTAGLIIFAVMLNFAGLVPATFVLIVITSLGDPDFRPLRTLISAAVIAAIGYVIFVRGFRLPLQPFWW
jgi:hypothetical protein